MLFTSQRGSLGGLPAGLNSSVPFSVPPSLHPSCLHTLHALRCLCSAAVHLTLGPATLCSCGGGGAPCSLACSDSASQSEIRQAMPLPTGPSAATHATVPPTPPACPLHLPAACSCLQHPVPASGGILAAARVLPQMAGSPGAAHPVLHPAGRALGGAARRGAARCSQPLFGVPERVCCLCAAHV